MLDIAKLTQKERPKIIENDLNKNTKTIEAIQQDNLEFKENNFEARFEKIALSKKPT